MNIITRNSALLWCRLYFQVDEPKCNYVKFYCSILIFITTASVLRLNNYKKSQLNYWAGLYWSCLFYFYTYIAYNSCTGSIFLMGTKTWPILRIIIALKKKIILIILIKTLTCIFHIYRNDIGELLRPSARIRIHLSLAEKTRRMVDVITNNNITIETNCDQLCFSLWDLFYI